MLETELDPDNNVLIIGIVFSTCPFANTSASPILISILPASVKLFLIILRNVDRMVGETEETGCQHRLTSPEERYHNGMDSLGLLVVEGVLFSEYGLEGWYMDLVRNILSVHWVLLLRISIMKVLFDFESRS
jgi:hypothetical protein